MEQAWTVRRRDSERVQCPLCHDALADDGASLTECADCSAVHHAECWTDLERCAACASARARAPAERPALPPTPEAPRRCRKAGCRRLDRSWTAAERRSRTGSYFPELCRPHGAQAVGLGFMGVAAFVTVLFGFIALVEGLRGKQFLRGPLDAWVVFGLPITFAVWGLLTIVWGILAERTEPNEPTVSAARARRRS